MKTRLIAFIAVIAASSVLSSCYKTEDTIAEIEVVTANNSPVPGAEVRLFAQGTENTTEVGVIRVDTVEFTANNGVATFDFSDLYKSGQSGLFILNVEITREFPDSTVFLEGIIRVAEEETTRRTFKIQ
jgi:hypothetical protein